MELLVVSVSRQADGRSLIGFGRLGKGTEQFVRLVAPTPSGTLYPEHHKMQVYEDPRPFDLIRVEAPWADSRPSQPENRIVDDTPWELLERPASRPYLQRFESRSADEGPLFGTTSPAVRANAEDPGRSILCIEPREPVAASVWDARRERYRARIRFSFEGTAYDLPLTDLHYSQVVLSRGEGDYKLDRLGCRAPHGLRLIVTLGEPFHGWSYKMAAGILPRRTVTLWRDAAAPTFPIAIRNAPDDPLEHGRTVVAGA